MYLTVNNSVDFLAPETASKRFNSATFSGARAVSILIHVF